MNRFKALILAGVCTAALGAVPAAAEEMASTSSAFGSLTGGYSNLDASGFSADIYFANLTVGAKLWDTAWNLQGELGWEASDFDTGTEFDAFNVGGGVFSRHSTDYAFGAGVNWHGVTSNVVFASDLDFTTYGVFGEFYLDKFTLGGSLFGIDSDFSDGWGGQIDGAYYICDQMALRASYRHVDLDSLGDTGTIRLGGEYKLNDSGLAFGLNYEHLEFRGGGGDADIYGAQLKLRFGDGGGNILMDRDRAGAVDMRMTVPIRQTF